jgi:ribosomal protein L12E/L44/L45/RPP1/RPP2
MSYLVSRLKEKSTYSGILALLSAVGVAVDPEQFSAIAAAVMALVGVFEVFRREKK